MTEKELERIKADPKVSDILKLVAEIERLRAKISEIAQAADTIVSAVFDEILRNSD